MINKIGNSTDSNNAFKRNINFKGTTIVHAEIKSLPKAVQEMILEIKQHPDKDLTDSSSTHFLCVFPSVKNVELEQKFIKTLNLLKIKHSQFKDDFLEGFSADKLEQFFVQLRKPKN